MSLTTVNVYNLTSTQSDFTISFEYQKQSYVSVKVEDEALLDVSSNYSGAFTDATTYQFQDSGGNPEQIPSGYRVTFTRDTDISDDLFTFAAGTVIRPDALGESLKTLRDYTEEKNDQTANVTINIANDAITTATTVATDKAAEAAASATAASGFTSAAAGSASAASTSASNAATSETNAGTSETNAAASAAAAASSATSASTSVTNAAAQVTLAQAEVTLAQAEVAAATTQATNASTSATNAAGSETAAATSATNAAASETAAEAARDTVRDVILGQFANDAAVDTYLSGVSYTKDAGDLYFNTTDSRMKVYTGSAWVDIANTTSSTAAATSATAAQSAQAAAEAALASFNNKWHGEHASDSAVNSAISADSSLTLEEGDLYFDSTNNKLKVYNGSAWQNAASVNVINTTTLDTVGDVAAYSSLTQNDFLVRGSSAWENQSPATARASLGLGTATPTNDDFLKYNGTSGVWEDVDAATVKQTLGLSGVVADIATNTTDIATNTANIATNTTDIATNTTDIATNAANISTNTTDIATNTTDIATNTAAIATNAANISTNTTDIATNAANISTNTTDIATNATAISDKQATITTASGTINAQALTTYVTGDSGSVSVDVRKANPRTTTGTHTLLGGAALYYANANATYDVSALYPGDIVTIYCESGTVTVGQGSGSVVLFKDGEATGVASNATVQIGADTIATVTCVTTNKAIISGSDLT